MVRINACVWRKITPNYNKPHHYIALLFIIVLFSSLYFTSTCFAPSDECKIMHVMDKFVWMDSVLKSTIRDIPHAYGQTPDFSDKTGFVYVTDTIEINHLNVSGGLSNFDAFGRSVTSAGDLDGDGVPEIIVGANQPNADRKEASGDVYVVFMNSDGTVRNARIMDQLSTNTNTVNAIHRGTSVASLGDLNGDDIPDIAIGASGDTNTTNDRGTIYILLMNRDGTTDRIIPITHNTPNGPTLDIGDFFGNSIALVDDLDGNNVPDIAVGAIGDDAGGDSRGAVHILLMNSDLTIRNTIEINSTTPRGPILNDKGVFGQSVASTDLNNDGTPDIIAGTYLDSNNGYSRGAVHIMFMNSDGTIQNTVRIDESTTNGPRLSNEAHFGVSVASAGDLDNDGVDDVLVGSFENRSNTGSVYIMLMNPDGSIKSTSKINSATSGGPVLSARDRFGISVASIGDLNGDGMPDIVAGASWDDAGGRDRGAVHLMLLDPIRPVPNYKVHDTAKINIQAVQGSGYNNQTFFGTVSSIGDIDSDGTPDIAVGANQDSSGGRDRGAVYILLMNNDGTVKRATAINSATPRGPTLSDDDFFGASIASIGDINGDGTPDIAVGAEGDDSGGTNSGAVYILLMNNDGTVKSTVKINSATPRGPALSFGDRFGASVASIGDINEDGTPDIAVGAEGDDSGSRNSGAVHILLMNNGGTVKSTVKINSATPRGLALSNGDRFGVSVASIGDINGDGTPDIAVGAEDDDSGGTNRGAVHILLMNNGGTVKRTVEINSATPRGPALSNYDRFGASIASIGDINGDGTPDIAVGARDDSKIKTQQGAFYILLLNDDGTVKRSVKMDSNTPNIPDMPADGRFGVSIALVGDINGDGTPDIAVGADQDNSGGSNRGAVYIIFLDKTVVIQGITSSADDKRYTQGQIDIDVLFSEPVGVVGSPYLTLETGYIDRNAVYVSGNNTTVLTFRYTIQRYDVTNDLNYLSKSSLSLNKSKIFASQSPHDPAVLELPVPSLKIEVNPSGVYGPLALNKDIMIWAQFPPNKPINLIAAPLNKQVSLKWSAPIGSFLSVINYTVQYRVNDGITHVWETFPDTFLNTTGIVTGLTNGVQYQFRVNATNWVGTGPASDVVLATPRTVPEAPSNLTADPGNEQVDLSWTAPRDGGSPITGYIVEYTSNNGASWSEFADITDTYANVTGLTNGQQYHFRVNATNLAGIGPASDVVPATPVTHPGAPENLIATVNGTTIELTWDPPANDGGATITSYTVQQSTDGITWDTVPDLNSADTKATTPNVLLNTKYSFRVNATNAIGTGPASDIVMSLIDTKPSVRLSTNIIGPTSLDAIPFTISVNERVTGLEASEISTSSGIVKNLVLGNYTFGELGSGDGEFLVPFGIAINGTGHVYVTDSDNHRVQIFDAAGAYLGEFGEPGSGDGEFLYPFGIAINGTGHVYVIDFAGDRVQIFDAAGAYLGEFGRRGSGDGEFDGPIGIAINGTGHVYVTDNRVHRVQIFDAAGAYLGEFGRQGSGDGEFERPSGISINGTGHVYVADSGNRRVQIFDVAGAYLGEFGSEGSGNSEFRNPYEIAINDAGHVYVADTVNDHVQIFDATGMYLDKIVSSDLTRDLDNPIAVAIRGMSLYIIDSGTSHVHVLRNFYTFEVHNPSVGTLQVHIPADVVQDDVGNNNTASNIIRISIVTVPGVPQNLVATPGDATVTLAWDPPKNDGGAAIISYVVQQSIDGVIWTLVPDSDNSDTTATPIELTNDSQYQFRVNATNIAGTGPASIVSATPTDTTLPSVTINNVTMEATGAATSVNIGYPEITDASGGPYTVTHNATGNVQTTSGASNVTVSLGVGMIIVQWSVTDPSDNIGTALQMVDVTDTTPPTITLTGSASVTVTLGGTYEEEGAVCSDIVDADKSATVGGDTVNTDSTGQYTIQYTCTDTAGNEATPVDRTVTVHDPTAPSISINDVTMEATGATTSVNIGYPEITDASGGPYIVTHNATGNVQTTPDTSNVTVSLGVGMIIVQWSVTDPSDNIGTALQMVDVTDTTPPSVVIDNITMEATGATTSVNIGYPEITDASGGPYIVTHNATGNVQTTPDTSNVTVSLGVGMIIVQWSVTDPSDNIGTALQMVDVTDTTPPTITLTGSASVTVTLGGTYEEEGAVCSDIVDADKSATVGGDTVNTDSTGQYTIQYTCTDTAGNEATPVDRTVTVHDPTAPSVVIDNITMEATGATTSVNIGYPEITDASGGPYIVTHNATGNVQTTPDTSNVTVSLGVGMIIVQWSVTDPSDNIGTALQMVDVTDTTPPSVVIDNITMEATGATTSVNIGYPEITDASGGPYIVTHNATGNVQTTPDTSNVTVSLGVGMIIVQWSVTDPSDNIGTALQMVDVTDTTPPTITLTGSASVTVTLGGTYEEEGAVCSDIVDADKSATVGGDTVNTDSTGQYTIQYTCTDTAGNEATPVDRTVTVHDPTAPSVVIDNITMEATGATTSVNIGYPEITDASGGPYTVTHNATGNVQTTPDTSNVTVSLGVGMIIVQWSVTDPSNNIGTALQMVDVTDTTPPSVVIDNITMEATGATTSVNIGYPEITDASGGPYIVTHNATGNVQTTPDTSNVTVSLGVGMIIVQWSVTDPSDNIGTALQMVDVTDTTPPTITLTGSASVTVTLGGTYEEQGAVCSDIVDADKSATVGGDTVNTDSTGQYTIQYTCTDTAGNEATPVDRTVTVHDPTAPSISINDVTMEATGATTSVNIGYPEITDASGGPYTVTHNATGNVQTTSGASNVTVSLGVGMIIVQWNVTDPSNNIGTALQMVDVTDTTPPSVVIDNITMEATGATTSVNIGYPEITDASGGPYIVTHNATGNVQTTPDTSNVTVSLGVGMIIVQWSVTDPSDNIGTALQMVDVTDTTPPTITLTGSASVTVTLGGTYEEEGAVCSDIVDADKSATVGGDTVNTDSTGQYTIQYTCTDTAGNEATPVDRTVTVHDPTAPSVVIDNITMEATGATTSVNIGYPEITDASGGPYIVTHNATGNVQTTPDTSNVTVSLGVGMIIVQWSVTDPSDNIGTALQMVDVTDTTPPTITLIGSASVTVTLGGTYEEEGAVCSDIVDADKSATVGGDTVNTDSTGQYTIQYTCTDTAGNEATPVDRTVTVHDPTAPSVVIDNITMEATGATTSVNIGYPEITDASGGPYIVTHNATGNVQTTPDTSNVTVSLGVGMIIVQWNVTDPSNNIGTALQMVDVTDTTPPSVVIDNITMEATGATTSVNIGYPEITDASGGPYIVTHNATGNVQTTPDTSNVTVSLGVGMIIVQWSVTDPSDNIGTALQMVDVTDTTPPTITLTGSASVTVTLGGTYEEEGAVCSDIVDADKSATVGGDTVNTDSTGQYTIQYTCTDTAGNEATPVDRTVTVHDPTAPSVVIDNITMEATGATTSVNIGYPEITDASGGPYIVTHNATGNVQTTPDTSNVTVSLGVGMIIVQWNVTDPSNNIGTALQMVDVTDTTPPSVVIDNITMEATGATTSVNIGYPEITDASGGPYIVTHNATGNVQTTPDTSNVTVSLGVGMIIVQWSVTDPSDNIGTALQMVDVTDTTPPTITLTGSASVTVTLGGTYEEEGAVCSDIVDADKSATVGGDTVNTDSTGQYTIQYTCTDTAGNEATPVDRTVTVHDPTAPSVVIDNITMEATGATTSVNIGYPEITDASGGPYIVTHNATGNVQTTPDTSNVTVSLGVGMIIVQWNVTDPSNNIGTALQMVDVTDTTPPTITLTGSASVTVTLGGTYEEEGAVCSDIVDADKSATVGGDTVNTDSTGQYTIQYTCTDTAGNEATPVDRTVTVHDPTAPSISINDVTMEATGATTSVNIGYPEITDASGGPYIVTHNATGNVQTTPDTSNVTVSLGVGMIIVQWSVTDPSDNIGTALQMVDVTDTTPPTITLTGSASVTVTLGGTYEEQGAVCSDIVDADKSATVGGDTVNTDSTGQYTIQYTCTDTAGNEATPVDRTVTVHDPTAPSISINDVTMEATGATTSVNIGYPEITDASGGPYIVTHNATGNVQTTPDTSNVTVSLGVGMIIVQWNVTDPSNNIGTALQMVDVTDTTPPSVVIDNITMEATGATTSVNIGYPEITDASGGPYIVTHNATGNVQTTPDTSNVTVSLGVGMIIVQWNVTDPSNNIGTALQMVDVTDTTPPTITLTGSASVTVTLGGTYEEEGAVCSDIVDADKSATVGGDTVNTDSTGQYTIQYTCTDTAGNEATPVDRTVTVHDPTAPSISINDVTMEATGATTSVNIGYPEITDASGGPYIVTHNATGNVQTTPDTSNVTVSLGVGMIIVQWSVTDPSDNIGTALQMVDVTDTTPPTITLTGSASVTVTLGGTYEEEGAVCSDIVDADKSATVGGDTVNTDSTGQYTIQYTCTDTAGNEATPVDRTVTVHDPTAPSISINDVTMEATGATTSVNIGYPEITDASGGPYIVTHNATGNVQTTPDTSNVTVSLGVGMIIVQWNVTDPSNNIGTALQMVDVTDTTPPTITLTGSASVTVTLGGTYEEQGAVCSDIVDADKSATVGGDTVNTDSTGQYTIQYTCTDTAGNEATPVDRTVTVHDPTAPSISINDVTMEATGATTSVNIGYPEITDASGGPYTVTHNATGNVQTTPDTSNVTVSLGVGMIIVQWNVTDPSNNIGTALQMVDVTDTTPPSVVIDNITMEATGATTSVNIGYPEITDASGGPYIVTHNATGNVQTTPDTSNVTVSLGVGMIIVQWSVTDPSDNIGTALQMVDVTDTTPPTITLTGSASVTVTLGGTYEEEGAVCSDIVDADKSATVGGDTVNTDSTGQYTIQYTCTDTAGNEATPVDRTVTVHDPTAPSVVIDNITMEATGATTSVNIGYPEITDASGGPYIVTHNATGNVQTTPDTSNVTVSLGVGMIIVQWSVTDPSDNIGTALQMVDVTDTTPPTITLTGSASVTVTLGGTYEEEGAVCSDIVDADKSATVGGDTVNTDSTGQYTIQYTCTDTAGNEATPVDRTVTVHDPTAPSVVIDNITMEATGATTSVNIGYPEITDASGGPYIVTHNATGNVQTTPDTSNVTVSLGVGMIIVQWSVTDPSDNIGTALQMVDVTDTTPPTITLTGSASVTVTLGGTYEEEGAVCSDIVDADKSATVGGDTVNTDSTGQYTIQYTCTDTAGNEATPVDRTVTVHDPTAPSISINDVTMEATGATTSVNIGYPEITDASGGPYIVTHNATGNVQTTPDTSNVTVSLGVGMIIVQWSVTDPSDNIGTALQMVDVTDTTPPTITLTGSASVTVTLGGTYEEQGAVCSDIVDADKSATVGGDTVNTDSTGQYTIQYTCTDTAGNEATPVDRTVTVHDPTAPSISINDVTMEATGATTSVNIGYPEITDASGGPYIVTHNATGNVQTTPDTSNVTVSLGVGMIIVQWNVTDPSDNIGTALQMVDVTDTTPPSVVIDNITMEATGATTSVNIGYPEITDASGGPYIVTHNATGNVQTTPDTSNVTVSLGVGMIIVQWSVTDPSDNIGTALQMVDVTDTTPPTITLTGSASVTVTLGGTYEEEGAVCSDIVDADKSATVGGDTVNTDSTGQYTIQYTCTDTAGNEATPVDRTVTVHDPTAPSISINDVTMEATGATTSVNIGYPEITDASGGPYIVTHNATGNVQTTPDTSNVTVSLGVGMIIVQWSVTDPSDNIGTALQMVDVTDTTPPTITLTGSASVTVTLGGTYEEQGAVCSDIVDADKSATVGGDTVNTDSTGQYTIQYTCTDTAGNEATPVDRTVTVHDPTAPSISINDVTMEATGATTSVNIGYPEITDASGGPYIVTHNATGNVQTTPDTSNVTVSLGVGMIIVQWSVTDPSDNIGTALQMVDVTDTTPPTITLTGSASVTVTLGGTYEEQGAVCSDIVDADKSATVGGDTVNTDSTGQYTIQYTCTDTAGNEATPVDRTVTVHDPTAPSISINDVTMEATGATTSVNIGYPEITDASGGPYIVTHNATGNVQTTPDTSNVTVSLGVGMIIVQWNVTDPSDNIGTALQMVDVTDTTPPSVVIDNITMEATGATTSVNIGYPEITDASGGPYIVTHNATGNVQTTPDTSNVTVSLGVGMIIVQWSVTDPSDNIGTALQMVDVTDTTPPTITLTGSASVTVTLGGTYEEEGAVCSDIVDADKSATVGGDTVNTDSTGQYTIQYTCTDTAGNEATPVDRTVTVHDPTAPSISINDVTMEATGATTSVNIGYPEITDASGGPYIVTHNATGNVQTTPDTSNVTVSLGVGMIIVQWSVTDPSDNIGTALQMVDVTDTTPPTITLTGSASVTVTLGGTYEEQGAVCSDIVDADKSATVGGDTVNTDSTGQYTIQYTCTDTAGNEATPVDRTVTVHDPTAPSISINDVTMEATGATTSVNIGYPEITDASGGPYIVTHNATGNVQTTPDTSNVTVSLGVGMIIVQWNVTDPSDNIGTALQMVDVTDTTPPSVVIDNITMEATGATTSVNIGYPEITDASGGPYIVTHNATGNVQTTPDTSNVTVSLGVGMIIVQWSVTDPSDNIGTALQMVDVTDTTPPTITLTGSASVTVTLGGTYEEEGAVCSDIVDADKSATVGGDTVNTDSTGQYTIQYTCTDTAGNEATPVSRTVTVHMAPDTTSPSISINDVTMEATGATTSVNIGYPEITDASGGPYTVTHNATGNVQTTPDTSNVTVSLGVGMIIVQWSVTDPSDNIGTALQMVDVTDTTPPTITLTGSASVTVTLGGTYEEEGAVCSDIVDADKSATVGGDTVNTDSTGQYTIQYTCTDTAGNEATPVSRTVTVHMAPDTTSPSISINDVTMEATGATTSVNIGYPEITDASGGPYTVTHNATGNVQTTPDTSNVTVSLGVGMIIVQWNVTDPSNNIGTALQMVDVTDTTPPTITLTGSASVTITIGNSYVDAGAVCTDLVDGDIVPVQLGTVNAFAIGQYTIQYTCTDATGNEATPVNRTVTVNMASDTTSPSISIDDVTMEATGATTSVNIGYPEITDASGGPYTVTYNATGNVQTTSDASNVTVSLGVGMIIVQWSVMDPSNNIGTALQMVDVTDTTPPTITLTGSASVTVTFGGTYEEQGAVCTDLVDGDIVPVQLGTVNAFDIGQYTIQYTCTDAAGNEATPVSRTVTVNMASDTTSPSISINDVTMEATGATTSVNIGYPEITDASGGPYTITHNATGNVQTTPDTSNVTVSLGVGRIIVQWNVTDPSNNIGTALQMVDVTDTTPPTITLIGSASVTVTLGDTYEEEGAVCSDIVDADKPATVGGDTVNTDSTGQYTIQYTCTDTAGNEATPVSRTVTVHMASDTTSPSISINDVTMEATGATTSVNIGYPEITDASGGPYTVTHNATGNVQTTSGASNVTVSLGVGSIIVQWSVMDPSNNIGTALQMVDVTDTTPPTITMIGSASVTVTFGGTYEEQGAICTDLVDGDIVPVQLGTVNAFAIGQYTIQYTCTDTAGNEATPVSRTVTVHMASDTTSPSISINDVTMEATGATTSVNIGYPEITDASGGPYTVTHNATGNVQTTSGASNVTVSLGVGSIIVQWIVMDPSNNIGTALQMVDVTDTTPPTITLTGSASVTITIGNSYEEQGAVCTDLVDGDIVPVQLGTVNAFAIGQYTIQYTCTDTAGNEATPVNRTVTVHMAPDTTSPSISIDDVTMEATGATTRANIGYPEITDVSGGPYTITHNATGNVQTTSDASNVTVSLGVGKMIVQWIVMDPSNNIGTALQMVDVTDTTPPTITMIGSASVTITIGNSYEEQGAVCTDLVDGNIVPVQLGTVNTFAIGQYTMKYTCTDTAGNEATPVGRTMTVHMAPDTTSPSNYSQCR